MIHESSRSKASARVILRAGTFLLFFAITVSASWTVFVWVSYLLGSNFSTLSNWAPLSLMPALALAPFAWRQAQDFADDDVQPVADLGSATGPSPLRVLLLILGLVPFAVVLYRTLVQPDPKFINDWLMLAGSSALLLLAAFVPAGRRQDTAQPPGRPVDAVVEAPGAWGLLVPYVVCVLAVGVLYLLGLHADADDTHFLGTPVGMLLSPEGRLWQLDPFFGIPSLPNYVSKLNIGESVGLLAMVLYEWTGISYLLFYYSIFPLISLALIPLPLYLLTRAFFPRFAWAGVYFSLAMLIIWSTDNLAHGHFFLPRLYQGKSVFVSLLIPTLFLITRGLALSPTWSRTALLTLALITAGGLTSSGLYLALIAATIGWLAFVPLRLASLARGGVGLAIAAVPNLMMLAALYIALAAIPSVPIPAEVSKANAIVEVRHLFWAFGGRVDFVVILVITWIGMVSTVVVAWADPRARSLARFWLLLAVVALSPAFGTFIRDVTSIGNVEWRWYWLFHTGVIFALAAAGLLTLVQGLSIITAPSGGAIPASLRPLGRHTTLAFSLGLIGLVSVFLVRNLDHLRVKYDDRFHYLKIYDHQLIAMNYLDQFDLRGQLVLAEESVAQVLPRTLQGSYAILPRIVYLQMPYFVPAESRERLGLMRLMNESKRWTAVDVERLVVAVRERGIDVLAFKSVRAEPAQIQKIEGATDLVCQSVRPWTICVGTAVPRRPS